MKAAFQSLNQEFDEVFNPVFNSYNGSAGHFEAVINMGPVQPPQYSKDKLQELQHKFDDLEQKGVFARPEEVGITVEYLNPSFLIKKSNGGFRLVTAFANVGRYSKPQPALMPDVNSTLQQIAQWKHIIATDLTNVLYQIPLSRDSMKYCGVATPFCGVRVYTRSAMGMPGSETALEELICRVLGDQLKEGIVAKIADDLYCGGNTHNELLHNWRRVLHTLYKCDLPLSAKKTVICPKTTTILGWVWSLGTLRGSPHRVATLASCSIPEKVAGLRSFIGAYKVLAYVLPNCASIISPLDRLITFNGLTTLAPPSPMLRVPSLKLVRSLYLAQMTSYGLSQMELSRIMALVQLCMSHAMVRCSLPASSVPNSVGQLGSRVK
ncbi:uncharacterized protein LOC119735050 [Patiria miniata]|uniref:Reverse transcriptase domain-containing protein n=1 Tax=Patiria miniata TaxID=46514 RepID=A0A914AML1_PATMI|nr:uncharacterized protein LOC119735050 [Patiria miniata]